MRAALEERDAKREQRQREEGRQEGRRENWNGSGAKGMIPEQPESDDGSFIGR